MKTSAVSVTRGLLVFLVLAAAVDARGQVGQIYELTNYPKCDTSIIREWKEGLSLIYSRQPGSGNWFHLANSLGMTVASVKVGTDVKDMEIVDDTVYYCCMEPGSMYIGYFTIPDLLSPVMHETLVRIDPAPFAFPTKEMRPRRLEAFHVADGLHVIMLYDNKFISDSVKRVLVDVYRQYSVPVWYAMHGAYNWDDSGNIFYGDDIAVTDNYVVLVGHKHYSSGIHARSFYKPTNAIFNIFSSGSTLYDFLAYSGFAVLGDTYGDYPVWCTHTGDLRTRGNVVAIACMAPRSVGGSIEFGYTIKKYNAASPLSFSTQLFYPISTTFNPLWKVRDIRYDALSNNLLVLHDADAPDGSLRSMVSVVDNSTYSTVESYPNDKIQLHSMDKFNAWGDGVTAIGLNMVNGMFDWCIAKPVASPCFDVFSPTRALMGIGSGLDNTPVISRSAPTLVLENDYSVQTTPVNPLCKE
jgi:hypothetical protein